MIFQGLFLSGVGWIGLVAPTTPEGRLTEKKCFNGQMCLGYLKATLSLFLYFYKCLPDWIRLKWCAWNYFNTGEISSEIFCRFFLFVFLFVLLFFVQNYSPIQVAVGQYFVCSWKFQNNKPTLKREIFLERYQQNVFVKRTICEKKFGFSPASVSQD